MLVHVPEMIRPAVEIVVLGTVGIRRHDEIVAAQSARTRALLGALALAGRRGLTSAELTEAVWLEEAGEQHRSALSVVVHRARRWLAEVGGDAFGIEFTPGGYRLTGVVDAHRFTELAATAESLPDARQAELLAEAVGLWRGEDALRGIRLGPAQETAVEALRRVRSTATERYCRALLALGEPEQAVQAIGPLTDRYPLDEALQATLIEALAASGRQAEALRRYDELRAILAEELGVDPGARLNDALLRVLRAESGPVPTPDTVPAQLPPDTAGFAGRTAELAALDRIRRTAAGGSVLISALDGAGGVGKTVLALRWAYQIAAEFPDGQLYLDLRGYAPSEPVEPGVALGRFLRGLGVPAERVPAEVDEATALYRSLLSGRRMLVVLDNARSAEQVRPLLPASSGCLALVTSRDRLDGLVAVDGARRVLVDVLDATEALALLRKALGHDRVAAEPEAAAELVALCGWLPLALRITAAQLAAAPDRSLADQAAALAEDRWGELSVHGDPRASVEAAFDLSHQHLRPTDQRLFRLAGAVPGTDIGLAALAVLGEVGVAEVRPAMRRLVAAHLVREEGGRYLMHDLLRLYARQRAERRGDAGPARDRLSVWYLRRAEAAARQLYPSMLRLPTPPGGGDGHDPFDDGPPGSVLSWLDVEWRNLAALVIDAADHGSRRLAVRLADALRGYFWLRRHLVEWRLVGFAALAAATADEDLTGQAAAALSLGMASHCAGEFPAAIDYLTRAQKLSAQAGWDDGQYGAYANLGLVYRATGQLARAAEYHRQALHGHREHGLRVNVATDLGNLGTVQVQMGQVESAIEQFTEVLRLHRELGSKDGQALALNNLGESYHRLGRQAEALAALIEAHELYHEIGSRHGEADTLANLAAAHRDAGDLDAAHREAETAHRIAVEAGDHPVEAAALNVLGTVLAGRHRYPDAVRQHRAALDLARVAGVGYQEVTALLGLAVADRYVAGPAAAGVHARHAMALAETHSYGLLVSDAKHLLD
jgi:tetratricopeptide (TPR) repeat protein